MKYNAMFIVVALLLAILIPSSAFSISGRGRQNVRRSMDKANENVRGNSQKSGVHPVEVAGSRLPDCTHACGSCSPCKLVIVSSTCESLHQAETCPVSYRCMCNNKSYPVP